MFGFGKKKHDQKAIGKGQNQPEPNIQNYGIPTIKADPARVTETVKADLRKNIKLLNEIGAGDFDMIYDAALRAITAGGALNILYQALMTIDGMHKRRAENISLSLNRKANSLISAERQKQLGIKYAIWRYSGGPCGNAEQDSAHKAADGKPYLVCKGMRMNGRWSLPGREDGCTCYSRIMISGINGYAGGKPEGFVE